MEGNAAHWFVERHIEEGRSDKAAFREAWDGERELTYGAIGKRRGKHIDRLTVESCHRP